MVPGLFINELKNPAISYMILNAALSYIPALELTSSPVNIIFIAILFSFSFYASFKAEMKRADFDKKANNAEYNRFVDGETVPILSSDI